VRYRNALTSVRGIEAQISALQQRLADARARKRSKPRKKTKAKARKQSISKVSPGLNGNGFKKGRKKEFRDEEDMESEEDVQMTLTQKQELAEKIQLADEAVLSKAITIIQQTTNVGVSHVLCIADDRTTRRLNLISIHCLLVP
jgi:hypothetical protein